MVTPRRPPDPDRTRRPPPSPGPARLLVASLALSACFRGGEREKEPPPGYAGGLCLAPTATTPQPHCVDGSVCNADRGFCYDPFDPCRGFFCGGPERGACMVDMDGMPSCICSMEYSTDQYELLCCPTVPGVDDVCGVIQTIDVPPADASGGAVVDHPLPDAG